MRLSRLNQILIDGVLMDGIEKVIKRLKSLADMETKGYEDGGASKT